MAARGITMAHDSGIRSSGSCLRHSISFRTLYYCWHFSQVSSVAHPNAQQSCHCLLIENINSSPITFVTGPLLITVQGYVVPFCYCPLELNALSWILFCHPIKILNESLFTISH